MPWVYMLRCADGSYYVGSTRGLEKRVGEHQEGLGAEYTRRRRPVELVWSAEYDNVGEAFLWEKRIQNWSRAKREALIRGEFEALHGLAKKDFSRGRPRVMTLPEDVVAVTGAFLSRVDRGSPGLVRELYLHGSLCWGEFFEDSDIDFVAVLSRTPFLRDLAVLESAHASVREAFPQRPFEGFYCQRGDLAAPSSRLGPVPAHSQGAFTRAGRPDVNPVTWHEIAERGIVLRGTLPTVHTDLDELLAFSRDNLKRYWQPLLTRIDEAGPAAVANDDAGIVWVALGVARLHHLLAREELTSKSGAGRYIVDSLDPRWRFLARDALDIRERPGTPSAYDDPAARGRDLREFLAWAIADGLRLS